MRRGSSATPGGPLRAFGGGRMVPSELREGLTFDDVLLVPTASAIQPRDTDVSSPLTRSIRLNIPLLRAAMDTVTEARTAIAMAKEVLHRYRIEKLPVVDERNQLRGLITVKDIEKAIRYPNAAKDDLGRLRVGAAIGTGPDREARAEALVRAGVDVLVVDTAHGHSEAVIETVRAIKSAFPRVELIAGNVATAEGSAALVKAGVDAIKVGMGTALICTTRVVSGVGVRQLTALGDALGAAA